ncbi:MAG: ATP-binding protein [Deltaproteobacteria bacterium]|nr:ATP-binding protein [Deltaproteobacteria bacterium]MBM4322957.1 ATP-binding protein [Deltaproteobacteria bacterium]
MTREELFELIAEVQQHQSELDDVEVKSARGGTPKRLFESLSAFANRSGGGVMLFGVDEKQGFNVVGVGNADQLQRKISDLASSEMEPPSRPEFTVENIHNQTVVVVEVSELSADQKPCFYKPAGLKNGA